MTGRRVEVVVGLSELNTDANLKGGAAVLGTLGGGSKGPRSVPATPSPVLLSA